MSKDIRFVAKGDPEDSYYETYDYVQGFADGAQIDELEAHQRGEAFNAIHELHDMSTWCGDPNIAGTCNEAIEVIKMRKGSNN